jgi:hypothetical protein
MPFTFGGATPTPQQQVDLLPAADERGQRRRAQRLEPAQDAAFADDAPGALQFRETRELPRSEILDLEERADLAPRTVTSHERARLGQRLHPGSEVRRLADHSALLRRAHADQIADHDEAAGDAEPHIQRFRCSQSADCVDDGEPSSHRPFSVVLMRLRIAEIDQHPVTHVLGDKAGVPGDGLGDGAVIGGNYLAQILGIEPRRQCGRADQVAEHHRQLPPLGAIRGRVWRRCCRLWSGYFSDRPAAAPAEPCGGLVLEATSWAGNRQSRAALRAKAPRCRVFGHAAWAAHLEPWPCETIEVKYNLRMIAEEAASVLPGFDFAALSRVLLHPRQTDRR